LKKTLSRQVYKSLMDSLLSNELVPGMIINRREVASKLGVSVAPVLEAMLQLETEGFLESIPRKGTQVRPIRPEDIRGQLIVREALECQAARLYCGEPVEKNEARLTELAERLDLTAVDSLEHWKEELDFHQALIELTECKALVKEYKRVIHLNMFYSLNKVITISDPRDISNHKELVQKLKTRDPDEAARIMREHSRTGKGSLIQGLR
jgi:DNA-binding GntR family transcriptional regulator